MTADMTLIDSRGRALSPTRWRRQLPDHYRPAEPPVSPFAPTARLRDHPGQCAESTGIQPGLPGTIGGRHDG